MRAVFDSNVYLAAAKPNSYARRQIQRAQPPTAYELFISPEIILEVRDVLELKFGYTPAKSAKFIDLIMYYAQLIQPTERLSGILTDSDDHIILECALAAKADIIVSADRGLLKLKEFREIKIIHPTILQRL